MFQDLRIHFGECSDIKADRNNGHNYKDKIEVVVNQNDLFFSSRFENAKHFSFIYRRAICLVVCSGTNSTWERLEGYTVCVCVCMHVCKYICVSEVGFSITDKEKRHICAVGRLQLRCALRQK